MRKIKRWLVLGHSLVLGFSVGVQVLAAGAVKTTAKVSKWRFACENHQLHTSCQHVLFLDSQYGCNKLGSTFGRNLGARIIRARPVMLSRSESVIAWRAACSASFQHGNVSATKFTRKRIFDATRL